jgi:hypothetical protein
MVTGHRVKVQTACVLSVCSLCCWLLLAAGWMNDPHGMFEYNGRHHLFFQYNPRAIQWGE